jgi:hypothetical protein
MAKKQAAPVPDLLEGYSPENPETLGAVKENVTEYLRLLYLEMLPTQEKFIRIKNNRGQTPKTRLLELGNQSGKTTVGIAEDIAHAMGFRPWLKENDPDYRIKVRVPNQGLIGCEVAGQVLAQNIEPLLMKLIPRYCLTEKPERYNDGSLKNLTLRP